jgi:nucleotide-binding universal stress UspA family protein
MKKIIAAFDGLKFSNSTKEYAIHLATVSNAHLVGVFLDDASYTSYKIYELVQEEGFSIKKQNELDLRDDETRKHSVKIFEDSCQNAGIDYMVHHDRHYAINELLHESIYADLLVIEAHETFIHYEENAPTPFIKHTLEKAHCPVLVVPHNYKPIERIVLLYDGNPASVYAIKMSSYIFSALKHLPAEVVSIKSENQSLHLADKQLMTEFMKRHYPHATYTILKGEASSQVFSYFSHQHENELVVLGAYSRSKISRFLDESFADTLMKKLNVPLFIAHD